MFQSLEGSFFGGVRGICRILSWRTPQKEEEARSRLNESYKENKLGVGLDSWLRVIYDLHNHNKPDFFNNIWQWMKHFNISQWKWSEVDWMQWTEYKAYSKQAKESLLYFELQ